MKRTALYLLGLMVVVVSLWVLLTQSGMAPFVPATLVAAMLLVILGFGIMGLARRTPPEGADAVEREPVDGDAARVPRRAAEES